MANHCLDEEARRQDASDLDDEHDRVTHLVTGIELAQGVDGGTTNDRRVEERASLPTQAVRAVLHV